MNARTPIRDPEPLGAGLERFQDRDLLIADDDRTFLARLARAMEARGYAVRTADGAESALQAIVEDPPAFAVVDLRLGDGYGLDVIRALKEARPEARGVVLTGFDAIATAVQAVRGGAFGYLAKPADPDEVHAALVADPEVRAEPPERIMTADRVRWEHINRMFELCGRNMSEASRRMRMHRRTLQRLMHKRSPR